MDLSVDTVHSKDPLVLFGFEGFALSLLLPRVIMLFHSSKMTKDLIFEHFYVTKWPLCADVPLILHSFIHSFPNMYEELHCTYVSKRLSNPDMDWSKI